MCCEEKCDMCAAGADFSSFLVVPMILYLVFFGAGQPRPQRGAGGQPAAFFLQGGGGLEPPRVEWAGLKHAKGGEYHPHPPSGGRGARTTPPPSFPFSRNINFPPRIFRLFYWRFAPQEIHLCVFFVYISDMP